ncbi:MAG: endonuclease domain-containing protein [Acidimicrobiia bacterium]
MGLEDFDRLLENQRGACAICHASPDDIQFHVDHDHETGEVRGLLCMRCNNALGLFRESTDVIDRAADYVRFGPSAEDRDEIDALIKARVAALAT